jgi:hypothetical protein
MKRKKYINIYEEVDFEIEHGFFQNEWLGQNRCHKYNPYKNYNKFVEREHQALCKSKDVRKKTFNFSIDHPSNDDVQPEFRSITKVMLRLLCMEFSMSFFKTSNKDTMHTKP